MHTLEGLRYLPFMYIVYINASNNTPSDTHISFVRGMKSPRPKDRLMQG